MARRRAAHQWLIRDGARDYRTKLAKDETTAAKRALDNYLARKHDPRASDLASAVVADALALYQEDVIDHPQGKIRNEARRREVRARLLRLNEFFGAKLIASVGTQSCKDYVKHRGTGTSARREIEDLRAALNHFAEEVQTPAAKSKIVEQGLIPVGTCGLDFAAFIRKQYDEHGRIREANIKAE